MLTDDEGLQLIETMRRETRNAALVALFDWVIALGQRQAVQTARRQARNAYMSKLMKRLRRERAARKQQRA